MLLSALYCAADSVLQLTDCEGLDLANQAHQEKRYQSALLSAV